MLGPEERTISLPTGCLVRVDENRALVELPVGVSRRNSGDATGVPTDGWNSISSAIWNGGLRSFHYGNKNDAGDKVCVLNYKVPSTYDGLNPEPKAFLRSAIGKEPNIRHGDENENENQNDCDGSRNSNAKHHGSVAGSSDGRHGKGFLDDENTVGIMTAASMRSLRTASRSAGGIFVDAIVTAGISNARTAGADADVFALLPEDREEAPPPRGTINTVVVVNGAPLSEGATVEAYAIAIEAKCAACADFRLACAKSLYGNDLAQGTGTDCAVLLGPAVPRSQSPRPSGAPAFRLEYAGKHCLLAELIGQAVREATREAIRSNLVHLYGTVWRYHLHRYKTYLWGLLLKGSRPCVPPKPMDPMPPSPLSVVLLGWAMVLLAYFGFGRIVGLPRSATVLMAAAFWDRCLPEPPLSVHPVVLAGTVISIATKKWIPERVFRSPVLGFFGGVLFLVGTLALFVSGAQLFLAAVQWTEEAIKDHPGLGGWVVLQRDVVPFGSWVLEVVLFKTTFSLQLLCTIALQMARFLERSQLQEARDQLVWLCSRDPTHLGSEDLAGGTLESLSENLSDGTVAPWFWYILFGPVGALGYRVANTLDSRIGYRGGRYEWFGKASARFDDLVNLVPARLTTLALVAAAAMVPRCSAKRGFATAWKDCAQCSSPNAGWPMGAMAGILGVRLEKKGEYALGKDIPCVNGPSPTDIRNGHSVAQLAGGIAFVAALAACCIKDWITG